MITFTVTFKRGPEVVAVIAGEKVMREMDLTTRDVLYTIPETEQYLERVTGFRVHINVVNVE